YALVVADARLREALLPLAESVWEAAEPLTDEAEQEAADVEPGEAEQEAAALPRTAPSQDEQRELLALLAAGLKDEAIARRLGVHVHTARRRISRLLEALNARTRFQAGARAAERGWLRL
ncbi:helix-turn-helix domain-containing protein, partial [Streptomyces sp. TRM64462]|uniref:helix-turn-helix domain-containing protein n=1 Tax=Streptomyces sp. TRM64462 TaxID=2741726 RepID=UPI001586B919